MGDLLADFNLVSIIYQPLFGQNLNDLFTTQVIVAVHRLALNKVPITSDNYMKLKTSTKKRPQ